MIPLYRIHQDVHQSRDIPNTYEVTSRLGFVEVKTTSSEEFDRYLQTHCITERAVTPATAYSEDHLRLLKSQHVEQLERKFAEILRNGGYITGDSGTSIGNVQGMLPSYWESRGF